MVFFPIIFGHVISSFDKYFDNEDIIESIFIQTIKKKQIFLGFFSDKWMLNIKDFFRNFLRIYKIT